MPSRSRGTKTPELGASKYPSQTEGAGKHDFRKNERQIFFAKGLDTNSQSSLVGQISLPKPLNRREMMAFDTVRLAYECKLAFGYFCSIVAEDKGFEAKPDKIEHEGIDERSELWAECCRTHYS